jgi:hypothetical protein
MAEDTGIIGGGAARVSATGLAVVHEGELVLPAGGSEAQAATVAADSQSVVQYVFPVEIEVRGALAEVDHTAIAETTLAAFVQGMRSLA